MSTQTTTDLGKQEILDWAMNQVESVKQGNQSALEIYPVLNELKKSIDGLRKEIYDHVIAEADKYDKREDIVKGNYKISIVSKPNYQYGNDPEYAMIEQKLDNRKEMLKKATKKGQPLKDSETGEIVQPVDVKYSTYPRCEWIGVEV